MSAFDADARDVSIPCTPFRVVRATKERVGQTPEQLFAGRSGEYVDRGAQDRLDAEADAALTLADLISRLQELHAADPDADVWIIDDYGGMRRVGAVRIDRWPRGIHDEPALPGVQILTPAWADRPRPAVA